MKERIYIYNLYIYIYYALSSDGAMGFLVGGSVTAYDICCKWMESRTSLSGFF